MTVKEFAKLKGKSVRTIQDYCKKGLIVGTEKNENGQWEIPEGAQVPYMKCGKSYQVSKARVHVLRALDHRMRIDKDLLKCGLREFEGLIISLEKKGLIEILPGPSTGFFSEDYQTTPLGEEIANMTSIDEAANRIAVLLGKYTGAVISEMNS